MISSNFKIMCVCAIFISNLLYAKDYIVDCKQCIVTMVLGDKIIEEIKQEMGEEDFYVMADDRNHDIYVTSTYAKANGIDFIYVNSDAFDVLVFADQKVQIQNYFGYWIYKKGKEAQYFPDIPEDEINSYFNITNPKRPKKQSQ